jgi:hypothetical protein
MGDQVNFSIKCVFIYDAKSKTSDACTNTSCEGPPTAGRFPMSTFNNSGVSVTIQYGSGFASGPVSFDTVTVQQVSPSKIKHSLPSVLPITT